MMLLLCLVALPNWAIAQQVTPNFVNVDTYSGNANDVTVNMPAGSEVGDVVLVYVVQDDDDNAIIDEGGIFTELYNLPGSTNGPRTALFYRVIDGTEAASYIFDLNPEPGVVVTLRYQNLNPAAPFLDEDSGTGNSTTLTAPSVTTTRDNITYLQFMGVDGANAGDLAPSSGTATIEASAQSNNANGHVELMIVSELQSTAGNTPAGGFTFDTDPFPWTAITLALDAFSIETTATTGTACPAGTSSFSVAYVFGGTGTLELVDPLGNVLATEAYATSTGTATFNFTPTVSGTYTVRDQATTSLATTAEFALDTDGDSVCDDVDMDDDNDGILDSEENEPADYNLPANRQSILITANTVSGSESDNPSVLLDGLSENNFFFLDQNVAGDVLLRWRFPAATRLTGFEILTSNFFLKNGTVVNIEASNDGTNWTQIGTRTGAGDGTAGQYGSGAIDNVEVFPLENNNTAYVFYRILGVSGNAENAHWVYEIFFQTAPIIDLDGDGFTNQIDLDSDGDGIPDNVEAQTTTGYVAPNADAPGTYASNGGVNSAYLGGLPLPDTDTDGNLDYLDVDADNDQNPDSDESGLSLTGVIGANGLDMGVETSDDYSDVNGVVDDPDTDLAKITTTTTEVDYRDKEPPIPITVCYTSGSYNIGGSFFTNADEKLTNPLNFGDNGTSRFVFTLFSFGNSAISEAALIANGCDIFQTTQNTGDFDATEQAEIRSWAQSMDHVLLTSQQNVINLVGPEYPSSGGNTNPNSLTPVGETVVNGPFGNIAPFNQGGTFTGAFDDFPEEDACVIIEDAMQLPTGLLNRNTGDFYLADVDLLSELGGLTETDDITSTTDVLFANLYHSMSRIVVEGPANACNFFFCPAGDVAPVLDNSSASSAGMPVDLNPFYTGTPPMGTTLTWHNATPPADNNYIGNSASYTESGVVYAAFRANDGSCYSPATPFMVAVNYPDLEVTVSPGSETSSEGEVQTFTVTVTNNGSVTAPDAEVKVPIPGGRQLVVATPSAGTYSGSTYIWSVGQLTNGQSETLNISIRIQ
ncbi:MAG: DUF11 domain-containing protein [Bacteroidota bacterium]